MRCTDKRSRKYRAAIRRRNRLIRRMFFMFTVLCLIAAGIAYTKYQSKEKFLVAEYETSGYDKAFYREELYSADLCVAADNVDMKGAPATGTLKSAALFDVEGNKVDFAYNIHEKMYPASLTKLMTALVALDVGDLSDVVTVSDNADAGRFAVDEQVCGIKAGDQLTLNDLLYGLLLYSGNDNAVAIAEHISGSEKAFVEKMNEKAQEIMATKSHFVNSNGLHNEEHYTTAYDMYLIFNECIKNDKFLEMIQAKSYKVDVKNTDGTTRGIVWEPTNYYALGEAPLPKSGEILGGKTGTTLKAGNCLVLLCRSDAGKPYISIVMGAGTKDVLYQDMTALIEGISDTE